MANKKWGKLLAFTALAGTAIAGTLAYLKYKKDSDDFDDDFDDFDDELDDDEDFDFPLPTENDESFHPVQREYVSINIDSADSNSNEEPPKADNSQEATDNSEEAKTADSTESSTDSTPTENN